MNAHLTAPLFRPLIMFKCFWLSLTILSYTTLVMALSADHRELIPFQLDRSKIARIVNGERATVGEHPWQVALFYDLEDPYGSHFCGGSLIDDRWVISAAHCFTPGDTFYLGIGFVDLNDPCSGQVRASSGLFIHEAFNSPIFFNNDIALIKVDAPFDLSACGTKCATIEMLTSSDEADIIPDDTSVAVSGWGYLDFAEETTSQYLYDTTVEIINCADTELLSTDFNDNMICAADPDYDTDACLGDSGGPLTAIGPDGSTRLLAGLVSWGFECAVEGYPGVYTRVANYTTWVNDTLFNNSVNDSDDSDDSDPLLECSDSSGGGLSIPANEGGSLDTLFLLLTIITFLFKSATIKRVLSNRAIE